MTGSIESPVLPRRLLFLVSDTGGGHRAAARAVEGALREKYPGKFTPVLHDPLAGESAPRLTRWAAGLYGPLVRHAPWLWGICYYATNSEPMMAVVRRIIRGCARTVSDAVTDHEPAAIVSFHPLTAAPAVHARQRGGPAVPVISVVTDLISHHAAWRYRQVDQIFAPGSPRRGFSDRFARVRLPLAEIGVPVDPIVGAPPLSAGDRMTHRRWLGVNDQRFLVVLTGGGEGSGEIYRQAAALVDRFDDIHVVAVCGRNEMLRQRLARLASDFPDRLTVKGFVHDLSTWMRCADVVVGKAGPGTIAEAACCGVPVILTSHLPGQEYGNAEFVVRAGAGAYAPTVRRLVREIDRIRRNPAAIDAMRSAATRIGRPNAAKDIATLLAEMLETKVTKL